MTGQDPGPGPRNTTEERHVSEATIRLDDHDEHDDVEEAGNADALLAELWKGYVADRDPALRDRLILDYAPLVKYVAGRGWQRPARARRAGRPHLLRDLRVDRRDHPVRAHP